MEDWTWNIIEIHRRHIVVWGYSLEASWRLREAFWRLRVNHDWQVGLRWAGKKHSGKKKGTVLVWRDTCLSIKCMSVAASRIFRVHLSSNFLFKGLKMKHQFFPTYLLHSSIKYWLLQWDYKGWKTSCKEYYTENRFKLYWRWTEWVGRTKWRFDHLS